MICPHCNKEIDAEPVIIASGEDFEKYLRDQVCTLPNVKCELTKATGDQGADLIVTLPDGLKIAVQCKLYSAPVGNDAVQEIIAGRIFYKCDKAMVVTNSVYTPSATQLAEAADVELLSYKKFRGRIKELSGIFAQEIMSVVDNFVGSDLLRLQYGRELKFVARMSVGLVHDVYSELETIDEVLNEVHNYNRRLSDIAAHCCYEVIRSCFHHLPNLCASGVFGECLANAAKERESQGHPLRLEEPSAIRDYQKYWNSLATLLDEVDRSWRGDGDCLNFNLVSPELVKALPTVGDGGRESLAHCLETKQGAYYFLEYLFGNVKWPDSI